MDSMWDSIKRGLQDSAAIAFDKAEELTQVGRARLDIAAAKTRVTRLKTELGETVFSAWEHGSGAGLHENERVRDLCDRIRVAVADLDDAEEDFEQVRKEQATDDDSVGA